MLLSLILFLCAIWNSYVECSLSSECGRTNISTRMSSTENKLLKKIEAVSEIFGEEPEKFCSPLDLSRQVILSMMEAKTSRKPNFPWMVAIYGNTTYWCAGTLIDRVHVLAAADCFLNGNEEVDPSQVTIKVGNVEAYSGVSFAVTEINSHDDLVADWFYNNIAILTLESEILTPLISPICLPDETIAAIDLTGKTLTFLVWNIPDDSSKNLALEIFNLTLISHTKCREYMFPKNILETLHAGEKADVLCAESPEGGYDKCKIYSGGPLMYKNNYLNLPDNHPDIPWVLVGFSSFCNPQKYLEGFVRISAYIDWIQENI